MKSIRRTLSTLLCVLIIASMCVPAFASEYDGTETYDANVYDNDVETYNANVYNIDFRVNGCDVSVPSDVYVGYNYITIGEYVMIVQAALNNVCKLYPIANCYCGSVDGSFGELTWRAVCNFQTWAGISADGIVGPNTWLAFKKYCR